MPPAVWTGCAALALVGAGALLLCDEDAADGRVSAGRACRSTLPADAELSCGTYGFGDLRQVCPASGAARGCTPTEAVTVRNSGPSAVYVTVIHGARQGERLQGPETKVGAGRTAVLRPGQGQLLFDVTLRGPGRGPKSLTVVSVR
ncbi:hypothetical protein AB0F07_31410 [Streptomyces fructofermentans]|uniref:hypothetical protein n=1 Tax=Streptomyces fructofermentans TaxID=152141 RepID=UPI0033D16461